jgi:aminoglycoside phosphotransferase (APT) family kinase protein
MTRLLESVPDRNTFLHGDNHPGNIMVQNDEFMFIDLGVSGYGHPILDMMTMCGNYLLAPMAGDNEIKSPISTSFTNEEKLRIWKAYICTYLGTTDEAFIKKVSTQIAAISAARILFATVHIPGLFNEQQVNNLKRTAISYVDAGMEPICF